MASSESIESRLGKIAKEDEGNISLPQKIPQPRKSLKDRYSYDAKIRKLRSRRACSSCTGGL